MSLVRLWRETPRLMHLIQVVSSFGGGDQADQGPVAVGATRW